MVSVALCEIATVQCQINVFINVFVNSNSVDTDVQT